MKPRSETSMELYNLMLKRDFPEGFCEQITLNLNTDWTAQRMIEYLYRYKKVSLEDVADEMLAILSDRNSIMEKKELEEVNEKWNEFLNEQRQGVYADYNFYGWQSADVAPSNEEYKGIKDPRHLYDLLSEIWCADTCAPRMRDEWTKENMTMGQCSITAFLAQDIFGGEVYGILRSGGNYHCYNVIGDCVFDLTSEQFGDEVLIYEYNPIQSREVHFAKEEKRLRYEYLKDELRKKLRI